MTDLREQIAEALLIEIRRQAHDIGWCNAAAAMTRRDYGELTLAESRGGAEVLQVEDADILALTQQQGEPVAWMIPDELESLGFMSVDVQRSLCTVRTDVHTAPLYTHPQKCGACMIEDEIRQGLREVGNAYYCICGSSPPQAQCPKCGRATLVGECMASECPACPTYIAPQEPVGERIEGWVDLVERLKAEAHRWHPDALADMAHAAADEIESLRAERDRLREALEKIATGRWNCGEENRSRSALKFARAALNREET